MESIVSIDLHYLTGRCIGTADEVRMQGAIAGPWADTLLGVGSNLLLGLQGSPDSGGFRNSIGKNVICIQRHLARIVSAFSCIRRYHLPYAVVKKSPDSQICAEAECGVQQPQIEEPRHYQGWNCRVQCACDEKGGEKCVIVAWGGDLWRIVVTIVCARVCCALQAGLVGLRQEYLNVFNPFFVSASVIMLRYKHCVYTEPDNEIKHRCEYDNREIRHPGLPGKQGDQHCTMKSQKKLEYREATAIDPSIHGVSVTQLRDQKCLTSITLSGVLIFHVAVHRRWSSCAGVVGRGTQRSTYIDTISRHGISEVCRERLGLQEEWRSVKFKLTQCGRVNIASPPAYFMRYLNGQGHFLSGPKRSAKRCAEAGAP